MTIRVSILLIAAFPLYLPPMLGAAESEVYRIEHYEAALRLDVNSGRLTARALIRFRSRVDSLRTVELSADELTVTEVRVGRRPASFIQRQDAGLGGVLTIDLPRPLPNGRRGALEISYYGSPKRGLRFFPDQVWTAFSTSHWLPSDGHPGHRATLRLRLDLPVGWAVVASGRAAGQRRSKDRVVSIWDQRVALPSFLFGFAAGRFQQADETRGAGRVHLLSSRHSPQELSRLGALTTPMLGFFAGLAGVPYPDASYTQVFAHDTPMQEVGSFTLLPEQYADDLLSNPDDLWLMAHELAHQWWGIGVTCKTWSDFWLNEGMATYLADVYLGDRFGAARYESEIERSRRIWEDLLQKGQDRPLHFTTWTTPQQAGGRLPYHKGAWVLHLLREQIGADAFWRGLAAYTREHWHGSVTSADLQEAMERASGRSLAAFFGSWVYHDAALH
jgi:aminopeptidase N